MNRTTPAIDTVEREYTTRIKLQHEVNIPCIDSSMVA